MRREFDSAPQVQAQLILSLLLSASLGSASLIFVFGSMRCAMPSRLRALSCTASLRYSFGFGSAQLFRALLSYATVRSVRPVVAGRRMAIHSLAPQRSAFDLPRFTNQRQSRLLLSLRRSANLDASSQGLGSGLICNSSLVLSKLGRAALSYFQARLRTA
jgi:hypothetical protein